MSPKPDRRETLDFSDYYYQSCLVIVVKKGGKFEHAASLADFAGAKLTGQIDTVHYDAIDQIQGVVKLDAKKDFMTMRVALESGEIDGYVSEKPEGVSAQVANSNYKMVEFAEGKGFQVTSDLISISVGLKKGSDQTKKINEILAGISAEQRQSISIGKIHVGNDQVGMDHGYDPFKFPQGRRYDYITPILVGKLPF
jgi:ABC-type amino acid transport substrate-binding protein